MSDQASLRHAAATTNADADALSAEVAGLIVQALNLEIALVVSKKYGVQLRADSGENTRIFGSLRQLVDYIIAHRTK